MEKQPAADTDAAMGAARLMHTSIIGGSIDKEVTELAVIPDRAPSSAVVMTETPLVR
jgi:hypothetical protein